MKESFLLNLSKVEKLSRGSKLHRFLNNPYKYVYAIALKEVVYKLTHKEKIVKCKLFTGMDMHIMLPASTDIFLTGGKSHISEIRLARFLIQNLIPRSIFWDIGAHYGYFSLLASSLVTFQGKVISIEASPTSFSILHLNATQQNNVEAFHNAVSDKAKKISFFELPNIYSEYNSTDLSQYEKESWFDKVEARRIDIDAFSIDELYEQQGMVPDIIKIDVEGGEAAVINGSTKLLHATSHKPVLVMEYLTSHRNNQPHKQAAYTLMQLGYQPHIIQNDGSLLPAVNIDTYLSENQLVSDNIVFKK